MSSELALRASKEPVSYLFQNTANYILFGSEFCAYSIGPKNTRNCGQFGVCGTNLGADAVAEPIGPRRRRNACKRKWRCYHKPRLFNQGHYFGGMTDGHVWIVLLYLIEGII
ncbi:hypothetical protein L596_013141 [Steinernema carpocapsae]|uniref:Uncharacterized protein n=1 Tax=Steinernema carpocapsae TaxID=34508 RepID=A0A4U5NZB3_STECR|nr:hypothetical protein L596_013141 [Steinernema carpocapsae]